MRDKEIAKNVGGRHIIEFHVESKRQAQRARFASAEGVSELDGGKYETNGVKGCW